jgi:DHA1 family inner membrane transport protein
MPLAIIALATASFCIGTTEFVIMGLLPDIARGLGVSIPRAGLLVTGYALGVVVGAPIVAALVIGVPRKRALLGMIAMFVMGNLLCAIAPTYGVLLGARVVTAFCHGAFFGIGSVVAAQLVATERRAQAIAAMFAGLTLANVLGVPFGTALGNAYGWRSTFWAVAVIGALAAVAVAIWVPAKLAMSHPDLRAELRVVGRPQVILAMAISVFASASLFSVFTYITPLLERVTGLSPAHVTIALLIFGAGLTAGNIIGGRLADWKLMPSLIGVGIAVAIVVAVFALTSRWAVAAYVTIFVWGILAFALVPLLQLRIVDEAAAAPNLASTLNQGAFNLGNAMGAAIGSVAITAGVAYGDLPWIGSGIAVLALVTAIASSHLDAAERLRPAP